jgi:beta-galactosidase
MKPIRSLLLLAAFSLAVHAAPPQWDRLYHGVAYYPELWPASDVNRDIAEMQKLGINLARIGEFAWAKMEPDEGRIDLSYFRSVMDKLHNAGIHVVVCTPTATPPVWLTHGHPDRSFVDAEGTVMIHGARQHVSYEHPQVRKACLRIVDAMARELGDHPGLVGWQIDNEFKCHVAEDFSDAAVVHWRRWLENQYGTIDALNAAWGTDVWSQRYQRFDQVPAPRKTPFLHNPSLTTHWRIFSRESIAEFMDAQSDAIRAHSKAPITHNMGLGFSVNFERMSRNLDFVSWDDYPPANEWERIVRNADLFRAAKPGVPYWLMETSAVHNGWLGNHEVAHPPGFLRAEAVASYALGGQAFNYWLWRQQRAGCEMPHSALLHAWFAPSIGYPDALEVGEARKALEPHILASTPAPAVAAVTWSDRARAMLQSEPLGGSNKHRIDYRSTVDFWHGYLLHLGMQRDFLFEGAPLDPSLKLLITPMMPAVDEGFRDKVKAWVENGGIWICGPVTGTRTIEHTVPTDSGLGLVDDLAGVRTLFSFPITGTGSTMEAFGITAPLSGWCSAVEPADPGTRSLGTIRTRLHANGLSCLTERSLGKGRVVLLSTMPDGDEGNKIIGNIVMKYAEEAGIPAIRSTRGTLVCPRIMKDGARLWIVVNMDGKGGKVTLPEPATDAITSAPLTAGELEIEAYGYRALRFAAGQ